MIMKHRSLGATTLAVVFALSDCRTPGPVTPGQPSAVALTVYKTLITAQASLTSMRTQAGLDQYKAQINQAILSYNTLEAAFLIYAKVPSGDTSTLTADEATLAAQLTQLIINFTQPLNAEKAHEMQLKAHAQARFDWNSFLSYLQIAASVAAQIPITQPWSGLAQIILQIAQTAQNANASVTGIDVTQLHTLLPIT